MSYVGLGCCVCVIAYSSCNNGDDLYSAGVKKCQIKAQMGRVKSYYLFITVRVVFCTWLESMSQTDSRRLYNEANDVKMIFIICL